MASQTIERHRWNSRINCCSWFDRSHSVSEGASVSINGDLKEVRRHRDSWFEKSTKRPPSIQFYKSLLRYSITFYLICNKSLYQFPGKILQSSLSKFFKSIADEETLSSLACYSPFNQICQVAKKGLLTSIFSELVQVVKQAASYIRG